MAASASHLTRPATTLIGAGALGQALGRGIHNAGYPLAGVLSRTLGPAQRLAQDVGVRLASDRLLDLPAATRLVVCCVPDDALDEVADHLATLPHEWARTIVLLSLIHI